MRALVKFASLLFSEYVQQVDITPPFIHDLVRLSEKAGLTLKEEQKDILDTISTFNLQARIEPHPFSESDFNASNPLANEILKNGLEIA